jgi:integrase
VIFTRKASSHRRSRLPQPPVTIAVAVKPQHSISRTGTTVVPLMWSARSTPTVSARPGADADPELAAGDRVLARLAVTVLDHDPEEPVVLSVRRVFKPALRRAQLPEIRFRDLRHSFASLLIAQGEHPKLIAEQLGHASVKITMDRYGHLMTRATATRAPD